MKNQFLRRFLIFILTSISLGFLGAVGEKLFKLLSDSIYPNTPLFVKLILVRLIEPIVININLISIFLAVLFILIFVKIYRFLDKKLLKRSEVVFEDDFSFGNKGWLLNYWGSNDQDKTCRIENSTLILEAEGKDLPTLSGENGAYYDLTKGIHEGSQYEVSCWVKSTPKTTMGFKLWVHDTKGKNEMKSPIRFYTPGINSEEVKVDFMGTQSLSLRIHLHSKAGAGSIILEKVKVVKIK